MATRVAHYEMHLQGSFFQVKEYGYITFYDKYDDVCEAVIQVKSLEDAANLETIASLMDRRYSWQITQGELHDHEPVSVADFAEEYCTPVYIHGTYTPVHIQA